MMLYKTDNENFKDTLLFRCEAGDYEFLEIIKIDFDNDIPEYSVSIMSEPNTFIDRLKYLFKPEQYVKEILLSEDDIKILKKMKIK